MGRNKLNRTTEEIREQNRIRARRFYAKHKKRINKETMQRYYDRKEVQKKM